MKKSITKLRNTIKDWTRFFIVWVVATWLWIFSVFAATNWDSQPWWETLPVTNWDSLTSSMWNNLHTQVKYITTQLSWVVWLVGLTVDWNVWIWKSNPSQKLDVNWNIRSNEVHVDEICKKNWSKCISIDELILLLGN